MLKFIPAARPRAIVEVVHSADDEDSGGGVAFADLPLTQDEAFEQCGGRTATWLCVLTELFAY